MGEIILWSGDLMKSLRQFWQLLEIRAWALVLVIIGCQGALKQVILAVGGQGLVVVQPGVTHLVSIGIVGDVVAVSIIVTVTLLVLYIVPTQIGSIVEVCVVLGCKIVGFVELISIVLCGHWVGRRRQKLGGEGPG